MAGLVNIYFTTTRLALVNDDIKYFTENLLPLEREVIVQHPTFIFVKGKQ